jgi:hypothetical protein
VPYWADEEWDAIEDRLAKIEPQAEGGSQNLLMGILPEPEDDKPRKPAALGNTEPDLSPMVAAALARAARAAQRKH